MCHGNKICSKPALTWKLTLVLAFPAHCISNQKLNGISRSNISKVTLNAASERSLPYRCATDPLLGQEVGGKMCSGAWKRGPEIVIGVISLWWIWTYHKQLRISPKEKTTPKSHSHWQTKTSELPPSAENHFVVNYSIRAHNKARGADVQDSWRRCTYFSRSCFCLSQGPVVWAHLCWRQQSLLELGHSWSSRQVSLLEPGQSWSSKFHWPLVLTLDPDAHHTATTGLILGLCPANERRCYKVTLSLIDWAQT